MCGNRVEELETRVQELEASVEGLTDELVECKVRIRELENTVDEQSGFTRSPPEQAGEKQTSDAAESAEAAEREAAEESTESEILVPEAGGSDPVEAGTSKTEAPEETDNTADPEADAESETEDDSGSDIIVA